METAAAIWGAFVIAGARLRGGELLSSSALRQVTPEAHQELGSFSAGHNAMI